MAVTSPTASQVVGNTTGNTFLLTSTQAGCPVLGLYSVKYLDNGELIGVTRTAPYSYSTWSPYNAANGQHSITAVALDALNNVLATSPAIAFSVENDLPQNALGTNCTTGCSDISVTTGNVSLMTIGSSLNWATTVASFQGAGTVSVVGTPVSNGAGGASTMALVSAATAGNLFAVFGRVQNSGQTISVSDSRNGAYTCGTVSPSVAGSFALQGCFVKNIAAGSTTITLTSSGGGAILQGYAFQLTGASTTAPSDVTGAGNSFGSSQTPTSAQFNLASTNELILAFGSWQGSGQTATSGPGYTVYQEAAKGSAVETIAPPGSGWFSTMGITATVNGINAAIAKFYQVFVDGLGAVLSPTSGTTTASSRTVVFDTTNQFQNGSHAVVVDATGGNCVGCSNGTWGSLGSWEQQISFSNGALASQLLASNREETLCTTSLANCPTTVTLTGTILNTDGTTTPATLSTPCTSSNTAVITVSGTCTVNSTATTGSAQITMTESGGKTRIIWVHNLLANNLPHFLANGTVSTTYTPGQSVWFGSLFGSSGGFNVLNVGATSSFNYPAQFGPLFANGFNLFEDSFAAPSGYGSAALWQAALAANICTDVGGSGCLTSGYVATYGLKGVHLVADSYFRGTPEMFQTMYGNNSNWGVGGIGTWQYAMQQWAGKATGVSMVDEVGSSWGGSPLAGTDTGGILLGSKYFTSPMNCTSGTTCAAVTSQVGLEGISNFLILDPNNPSDPITYNLTSGAPVPYHSSTSSGTLTFTTPAGVGTHSYTSGSNPNLRIEPFVAWTYDASNNACPTGGASAGPCPKYIAYDVFKNISNQTTATVGFPLITWPARGGTSGSTISNWTGAASVAGVQMGYYGEAYWSAGLNYLPTKQTLQSIYNSQGNSNVGVRSSVYPFMNTQTPFIVQSAGSSNDYLFHGYPVVIASCSGNTITTTVPHGLLNILPDVTRVTITGSSGGLCNGNFYVMAAPTATTLQVLKANQSGPGSTTATTLTFQDGTQFTGPQPFTQVGTSNAPANFNSITGMTCPQFKSKRGQTFVVTGGNSTYLNNMLGGWISGANANTGCGNNATPWRELANFSASTGGIVQIVADNYYHQGTSWQTDSNDGPALMFTSAMDCLVWNGAGCRAYAYQIDPQLCDPTLTGAGNCFPNPGGLVTKYNDSFGGTSFDGTQGPQGGMNPVADASLSQQAFMAHSTTNQVESRLIPYAFQQRLPAPDYGQFFEASARTGPYGNLLMIQSYADNSISCTANLTPFLVGGQSIIRISATWAGIEAIAILSPGTTSDTMTCNPGEFRAYLFPNNAAAELQLPSLSVRLGDVSNATKIVVQFGYSPLAFSSGSVASQLLYQTFDAGTGNFQLPVDRTIGTIYYRLLYLDTNGKVLATGDVQAL